MKVLIVDDSAVVRHKLQRELVKHPLIKEIVGARDAYEAREMISQSPPNLIILDMEMPGVHGLHFLEKLMANYPLPVIVFSSIADQIREKAIKLGALGAISKPQADRVGDTTESLFKLIDRVANLRQAG